MKTIKIIAIAIVTIILCIVWGISQTNIFPQEQFGLLYIFSSIVGGFIIGLVGGYILIKILDD